jgi:hypothetical protein
MSDTDNIYVNVVMNHNSIAGNAPSNAVYETSKNIAFLDKPSDYYCSVIRFVIPLDAVPITIMPIVPNQGNPDLGSMIFGITVGGIDYPTNLIYTPLSTIPSTGPDQNQQQQVITPYYFIFDIQHMIDMMNTALNTSYIAAGSPGALGQPFFQFNPITQLISLIVSNGFIAANANIFCNAIALNFVTGIPTIYNGYNNPIGKDFIFNIFASPIENNASGYPTNTFPTIPQYFQFTEQFVSINLWFALRKLIITTSMPIRSEIVPGFDSSTGRQTGQSVSIPILTDFVPALENTNQPRSIAYYVPTSQYRLIDMIGNDPLYVLGLRIYWVDKQGNTFPLQLSVLQQASVKIGFFKKSLYKSGSLLH